MWAVLKRQISGVVWLFILVVILLWVDEISDLPHVLFGAPETPINWREAILETLMVGIVGFFAVWMVIQNAKKRQGAEDPNRAFPDCRWVLGADLRGGQGPPDHALEPGLRGSDGPFCEGRDRDKEAMVGVLLPREAHPGGPVG